MSSERMTDAHDDWQTRYEMAVYQFGLALKELHRDNPWPEQHILPKAISYLATELWDHGFSQTEILHAIAKAAADVPEYTAGEEVRP